MNDRIQLALDGDLAPDALTPTERRQLADAQAEMAAVMRAVPVEPLPDLGAAVLARLAARQTLRSAAPSALSAAQSERFALFGWLWRARPVSIVWRPAYGFAAVVLLAVGFTLGRAAPETASTTQVLTRFVLDAPAARHVTLAGDFTGWQPTYALDRTGSGAWTVVVPLDPGIHVYAFVVDGERWVPDPNAPAIDDGFGGLNSRLAVLAPDARGM